MSQQHINCCPRKPLVSQPSNFVFNNQSFDDLSVPGTVKVILIISLPVF
jgi:hypothetical protein